MGTLRVNTIQNAAGTGSPDILGESSAGNPTTGAWGEYLQVVGVDAVSNGGWFVTSGLSCTAGDWDITFGAFSTISALSTGVDALALAISSDSDSTTHNSYDVYSRTHYACRDGQGGGAAIPSYRINTSTSFTVYGKSRAINDKSNNQINFKLSARRVR